MNLTHYHTIPTFNAPEKEAFRKHCGKRRKCWLSAFSPFLTMFSTLHKTNFKLSITFILSFANAFNLDQSKILLSGNGLKISVLRISFFQTVSKRLTLPHNRILDRSKFKVLED